MTFRYKESQKQTMKTRTLPVLQFLWLILQHVLPKGFRRVRDYGLLRVMKRSYFKQSNLCSC
ncbi:transposase [Photobacterium damselae subsp. damselae]|uniref:transposase n=1 Tax=Photobacterium damselae TaxID=38293 RepID=UPI002158E34D|nr:transposase [Photobacterium damselae]